ncbi:hypothetical protein V8F06_012863 [Rhypophila decipiens]
MRVDCPIYNWRKSTMSRILQTSSLFTSILLPVLLFPITTTAQFNWKDFPYDSRECLNKYSELSSCDRSNPTAWNYCLCNNYENWIANVAACVNEQAPDDLVTVYDNIVAVCRGTGTPTLFSLDDFMAAAAAGTNTASVKTTSTTPSTGSSEAPPKQTETQTSTPEKESSGGDGGLTTSDKIAIGLGVPAGVFGVIGAVATWWMCRKRPG